jgi:hypothetical protein
MALTNATGVAAVVLDKFCMVPSIFSIGAICNLHDNRWRAFGFMLGP